MTDARQRQGACPHCGVELAYRHLHAGFSDLGFLYCDQDETVVTWSSFSPAYERLITKKHPWMLDVAEQHLVEESIGPCPCGGRFRFANPPLCPACKGDIRVLTDGPIYYIVSGNELDADTDPRWLT